jgi:endonuclease/exonuclease/phosphatase family metal-dependent hydrolase
VWASARFAVEAERRRWLSDRPAEPGSRSWGNRTPRVALLVDLIDRESDRRLTVAVTHWDDRSQVSRARSGQALAQWAREAPSQPWIVLGDFNDTIDSPALAPLLAAGFTDALASYPPAGPGAATSHAFSGGTDGRRIDHILVRGLEVVGGTIEHPRPGGRLPSDHWPVVARLRWPTSPTSA